MRIAEIYESVQGEGLLTGTRSIFVRASGCNLRCWFCDTPFASWDPEGQDRSIEDIVQTIRGFGRRHVVITGGEPMLFSELIPLCHDLKGLNLHITIETAGTLYLPLECDLMSISPKLSNSIPNAQPAGKWRGRHEQARHRPEVITQLCSEHEYQLKFVIDAPADCEEVEQYMGQIPRLNRQRVMLMPQGTEPNKLQSTGAWLQDYCRAKGLKFCPRRHIEWFGLARGT